MLNVAVFPNAVTENKGKHIIARYCSQHMRE